LFVSLSSSRADSATHSFPTRRSSDLRRGQDNHDEVFAQSAAPAARAGAGIRSRSGKARSRGEAASLLRTRPGGILSVDECSRDAGLPRFLSSVLESEDGTGVARAFWARSGAAHGKSVE